jgi:hypothetical protein
LFLGKKSRAKYCRNAPQRKVFGALRYANAPYWTDCDYTIDKKEQIKEIN